MYFSSNSHHFCCCFSSFSTFDVFQIQVLASFQYISSSSLSVSEKIGCLFDFNKDLKFSKGFLLAGGNHGGHWSEGEVDHSSLFRNGDSAGYSFLKTSISGNLKKSSKGQLA